MLQTIHPPELRRLSAEDHGIWFQRDGATSHTARQVVQFSRNIFQGRFISRNEDFALPARSPDSFLWAYLKSKVYLNKPRILD